MKTVKDFVGNEISIHKICDWLTKFYHKESNDIPKYAIIHAFSGNGKSFLGQLLANTFKVSMYRIMPYDINSESDLNDVTKSINIKTLGGQKHKLIFIDDFDEFNYKQRQKLYEIPQMSIYPVIYTTKTFSIDKDFYNFNKKGLTISLSKPRMGDMIPYIKEKLPFHYDKTKVEEILKQSNSFRSAVLSIYNMSTNNLTNPSVSRQGFLSSISRRKLPRNLNSKDAKILFDSIRGYDINALKVMMKVAEFDYRLKGKFERAQDESYPTIDKFFVNNMKEPIHKVGLKYQYKNNNKNNYQILKSIKKTKKNISSVDKWI